MRDEKNGWGVDRRRPDTHNGRPAVAHEVHLECRIHAYGVDMAIRSRERMVFDRDSGRLLSATRVSMLNDDVTTIAVSPDSAETQDYTVTIAESGERRKLPWPDLQFTLHDAIAGEEWVKDPGRKPGDRMDWKTFDFDRLQIRPVELRIAEASDWTSPDGRSLPVWIVNQYDPRENADFLVVVGRDDGIMRENTLNEILTLREEPEATVRTLIGNPDVGIQSLVPCDRPLGRVNNLRSLEIELTGSRLPELPQTAQQSVERGNTGTLIVRIGEGFGKPVPATVDEVEENTKATPRLPVDLPAVKELAARATTDAVTVEEKVRRLLDFVSVYVHDAPGEGPSLVSLLKSPRGDCTEHALLFTALARASGIPCREVNGLMYFGDEHQAFGGHAWNEVVIEGHWVPVDPTWNERVPNASHIQCASGELRYSDWSWMSGGLKIRILAE